MKDSMKQYLEEFSEIKFSSHLAIASESLSFMVPSIAPLITMYNSYKGEMEFNRLLNFFETLSEKHEILETDFIHLQEDTKLTISYVLEKLTDLISRDLNGNKKEKYVNFFVKITLDAQQGALEFDKIELFLQTLEAMTDLEFIILGIVNLNNKIDRSLININNIATYIILGNISTLINKGLLVPEGNLTIKFDGNFGPYQDSEVRLSEFGQEFISYILNH